MSKITILLDGKAVGDITFQRHNDLTVNIPSRHQVVVDHINLPYPMDEDDDRLAKVGTLENTLLALNDLRYRTDYSFELDIDDDGDTEEDDDADGDD